MFDAPESVKRMPGPVLPETTTRAWVIAPPIEFCEAAWMMTPVAFGRAAVPVRFRPMVSFWTMLLVDADPVIETPGPLLPEIRFWNDEVRPPTVLLGDPVISTPMPLGAASVPVASVPIRLPWTALPPMLPVIATPAPLKWPMASPRMVTGVVVPVVKLIVKPLFDPAGRFDPSSWINGVVPVLGSVVPSIVVLLVIVGRGVNGLIVWTPVAPAMLNWITFAPEMLLESRIAWRSEPAPASAVFVTNNVVRS